MTIILYSLVKSFLITVRLRFLNRYFEIGNLMNSRFVTVTRSSSRYETIPFDLHYCLNSRIKGMIHLSNLEV